MHRFRDGVRIGASGWLSNRTRCSTMSMMQKDPMRRNRWTLAVLLALGSAMPLAAQTRLASADTGSTPGDGPQRGLVTREELIVDRLQRLGIPNPDPAPRKP